ncbi:MAG TPA: response regulator [Candidatus Deferrimicrobium sp.]|nr:response regulator [Candidatus Kapabacteria bacterium]HLP61406.1 response regulator [Candidatus Deferrimicrobium sp.]
MKYQIAENISTELTELKEDERPIIMIVDDEQGFLNELEKLLSDDYRVKTAQSAEEALVKLHAMENPEKISLIICDQRMSGKSGVELFKELANKPILADTVRIILTGYDDKEVMRKGINDAHIYKFVLKPYDPDELLQVIRDAVESFYLQEARQIL